eukprot:CAMPEP_0177781254 /NCGR_PEP_ID=MMETSP0491_2-20121128/17735_1 /TAXON_ID=63592 /ORGANISM="Tetraselmis chuii, Strain PLY429" /LENGTH=32 /DNA_ID= /DNA_START= /DNA_END= /DNA_ORIENTATION=
MCLLPSACGYSCTSFTEINAASLPSVDTPPTA